MFRTAGITTAPSTCGPKIAILLPDYAGNRYEKSGLDVKVGHITRRLPDNTKLNLLLDQQTLPNNAEPTPQQTWPSHLFKVLLRVGEWW
jgi:hypothetical protein